ncbi:MAG: Arginine transport ATP-binding protein ArtM [Frankiales bacterium]|nr:Arginine transport ATP-binding protein ArtM [Frankiales bacterium]
MTQSFDYINQIIIYATFAMSLNLVQGYTGQASIAQAAFGAVGGYTAALLSVHAGMTFVFATLIGMVVGFVLGVLVSLPALGVGADFVILLTLAFAYIVSSLLGSIHYFGGQSGIIDVKPVSLFGHAFRTPNEIFPVFLVIGLLVLGFCWRVGESGYGRVLKGLREDEPATRSLGLSTVRFQASVFGIASAIGALGGSLFVYYYSQAAPASFSLNQSILFVIMVVLGGSGNLIGSIVGAALITLSTPVLQDWVKVNPNNASFWQQVVYGALLILLMVFRPAGLIPEHVSGRPRWWQRLGSKNKAVAHSGRPHTADALAGGGSLSDAIAHGQVAPALDLGGTEVGTDEQVPALSSVMGGSGGGLSGLSGSGSAGTGGLGSLTTGEGEAFEDLDDPEAGAYHFTHQAPPPEAEAILTVTGLVKRFGGITAVAGVDMQVARNQVTALIGPNGAGKSTLFGLFTGFMPADEGSVVLNGEEVRGKSPNAIARLGMVRSFQDVRLFRYLTALQNVMIAVPDQPAEFVWKLFAAPGQVRRREREVRERALELLASVGMLDEANTLCGDLGHGEQKLVAIARVLATNAELLLLDEPTSGVEPEWVERVAAVIRELPNQGKTVCVVEHNLAFLQMLNANCYFMEAGRIRTKGTLDELMAEEDLRRAYFGV